MNKKITLIAAVAALGVSSAFAQVQRLVLVEEFTQASCPPCASQNPAFNALLNPNLGVKVAAIKYQTNWPGVDPMNVQTQTWVGPRVTYYAVNGVPDAIMDGNVLQGAPSSVTQSGIDNRYNVGSPFSLALTHTMSANFDSVYISVNITAAQAFTSNGALKLRVALVEKEISFSSAPGSNGETVFHDVMRSMIPNATGTALAGTWANGDVATFTFAVAKPTYVYDVNQLHVVAFIQSDGNKEVHQAALTNPIPLPNDAQPTAVAGLPSTIACAAITFTPSVTVKNTGANTLTSLDLNVTVGSVAQPVYNWTGSLASGATAVVTLPAVTYNGASGNVPVVISTSNPNATVDVNTTNDTRNSTFLYYGGTAVAAPMMEGFASSNFPPGIVGIVNTDGDAYTWTRSTAGGFAQGTGSARLNFFNAAAGTVDDMVLGNFNMTTATSTNMTFSLAYRQYQSENDRLQVMASTDCGATWTTVYDKQGSTLATVAASQTSFTPNAASQWRTETVSLSAFATATNVLIKFVGTSAYGNNLYVDDINIGSAVGVEETSLAGVSMSVFPNPFDASAIVSVQLEQTENITVELYSMDGKLVLAENKGEMVAGQHNIVLDGTTLADGLYFVTIRTANGGTMSRKVSVAH
ncbi:MAG: Omp28-related outer membrane protein [Bacteroidia bacterium]